MNDAIVTIDELERCVQYYMRGYVVNSPLPIAASRLVDVWAPMFGRSNKFIAWADLSEEQQRLINEVLSQQSTFAFESAA